MAARSVSRRGRLWAWLLAAGVVAAAVRAYGATADDHRARRHHSPRLVGVVRGGLVHRHRLEEQRCPGTATAWWPSLGLDAELGFRGWGAVSGGGSGERPGTRPRFRRSPAWHLSASRLSECSNLCL